MHPSLFYLSLCAGSCRDESCGYFGPGAVAIRYLNQGILLVFCDVTCSSGRLDRKIEFPHPTEEARARILQIHSRKMNVSPNVNFDELARCTDDFNGAQLKVCT